LLPIDAPEMLGTAAAASPITTVDLADQRGARVRRRALCVGINSYRRSPLRGCVADARRWALTLERLGFEPPLVLTDGAATYDRILVELETLIRSSRPGDVLVFQYAGHGTTVPDRNADELCGDSPATDEALCPIDFEDGRLIIDDDLAAVLRTIPAAVRLTSFIDACHSGSVSRLGLGGQPGRADVDERPRFIVADQRLVDAHFAFRASHAGSRVAEARQRTGERDTLFSACQSTEVAWESNGQGDFTRHATQVLSRGLGLTHGEFLAQVRTAFGATARQHPEVYPLGTGSLKLLSTEPGREVDATSTAPLLQTVGGVGRAQDVAALLRSIAALLLSTPDAREVR
jgi:hypothetical protein